MMWQTWLITLALALTAASTSCGNGVVEESKQYDDGNLVSGDGCSASFQMECYYQCDTSLPNICKIDAVVILSLVGISRLINSNVATILFKLNYGIPIFCTISFTQIFTTSIPSYGLFA